MAAAMYIRFGDLPPGGRSRNDETGALEPGVSVYRAHWDNRDRDAVTIEIPHEAVYAGGNTTGTFDRPVYVVTGRVLPQRGSDGEPLMAPGCRARLVGPVEVVNYVIVPAS